MKYLPSVDIFEKGCINCTKVKLFFKHNSSAVCEHVAPINGDEKILCINSLGDELAPTLVKLIITMILR